MGFFFYYAHKYCKFFESIKVDENGQTYFLCLLVERTYM